MKTNQILRIQTSQIDELESFIFKHLTPIRKIGKVQEKWQADFQVYPFDQLFMTRLHLPFGLSIVPDPVDEFLFLEMTFKGQCKFSNYPQLSTYFVNPVNSFFINNQLKSYLLEGNALHSTIFIPKKLINAYAGKMINHESDRAFHLQSCSLPMTEEAIAFRRYLNFIMGELIRGGQLFKSDSTILEVQNTILSLLISTSKNNYFELDDQTSVTCCSKYINHAIDYIEAHLTESLSLADLAVAVGVHSRTLTNGFKKYYNISPMAFVKQKRLEKTHQLLLEADPSETTVTDIATQYNFLHLGRFSQDYFNLFHEFPSATLRNKKKMI